MGHWLCTMAPLPPVTMDLHSFSMPRESMPMSVPEVKGPLAQTMALPLKELLMEALPFGTITTP